MPRPITNPVTLQQIIDLMAGMVGFMGTVRGDCEGDIARYKEEYVYTIGGFIERWEELCRVIFAGAPVPRVDYVATTGAAPTPVADEDEECDDSDEEESQDTYEVASFADTLSRVQSVIHASRTDASLVNTSSWVSDDGISNVDRILAGQPTPPVQE